MERVSLGKSDSLYAETDRGYNKKCTTVYTETDKFYIHSDFWFRINCYVLWLNQQQSKRSSTSNKEIQKVIVHDK